MTVLIYMNMLLEYRHKWVCDFATPIALNYYGWKLGQEYLHTEIPLCFLFIFTI